MLCKVGETQPLTVKNNSVRGIQTIFTVVHKTADTAFANHEIDLTQVNISATLVRGGKTHMICQDQLLPLALATTFFKSGWKYAHPQLNTNYVELRAKALGVTQKIMLPIYVDFGGIINVKNDDELKIRVSFGAGAAGANVDTANSYVEVYGINDVGNESTIPQLFTSSVQAGQTRAEIDLGNNVKQAFFLNSNKSSRAENVKVIDELNYKSDKVVKDLNYVQLIENTVRAFETKEGADTRYQSFLIASEDELLHNVQVMLSLDSDQVTAGKNWVVAYKAIPDRETLTRAIAREKKHNEENEQKLLAQI